MATRHLRRLQQQSPLTQLERTSAGSEDEDSDEVADSKPFNPFDLLSDAEVSEDEDVGEETALADKETADPDDVLPAAGAPYVPPMGGTGTSKKSKGKGKQRRHKSGKQHQDGVVPPAGEDDDIDEVLKQLNIQPSPSNGPPAGGALSAAPTPLLGVDLKKLRGDEELRRLFGSHVIDSVDREEEQQVAGRQRARGPGRQRRPWKRTYLSTPRDNWPPCEGGLSMVYVGSAGAGASRFCYQYSPQYQATQRTFEQCQASYDPNSIAQLLQHCPYHVDALLAMYDLYRHMGENDYAQEVLNRALYALEAAWHPSFDLRNGTARLSYELPENRALFTALFRHLQGLSRKGCHRSALECCKLLLSLDPEDPMGCLQTLDYLALRAGQHTYLRKLVDNFSGDQSLWLLPNFSYSLALAGFLDDQAGPSSRARGAQGAQEEGANGACGVGDHHDDLLLRAVLLHPGVIPTLMGRLKDKGVGLDAHWQSILGKPPFVGPLSSPNRSQSLQHLEGIFVERCHLLWKAPAVVSWLKRICDRANEVAAATAEEYTGPAADDWRCVREEAFPVRDTNEYRHLRLHDFTDQVQVLPREEVQAALAGGGMQEVEEELEVLHREYMRHREAVQAGQGVDLQADHPLLVLLRSLMPWVNPGQQPDYDREDPDRKSVV